MTAAGFNLNQANQTDWIIDSGATVHVAPNAKYMTNIRNTDTTITTQAGTAEIRKKGDVGQVKEVLLNKQGTLGIISASKLMNQHPDTALLFTQNGAYQVNMTDVRKTPGTKIAKYEDGLYKLHPQVLGIRGKETVNHVEPLNPLTRIHKATGHASLPTLMQLRKNRWTSFSDKDVRNFKTTPCRGCLQASRNQTHKGHTRRDSETKSATRPEKVGNECCSREMI